MHNRKIGDLVVPRKKGGMIVEQRTAADSLGRQLKAGEERHLGIIMRKHKDNQEDMVEMPQFLVQSLRGGGELWYYESDLARIIKRKAAENE